MCRNIKTLFNFDPPATDEEVRAASVQFVRKLSGFTQPSRVIRWPSSILGFIYPSSSASLTVRPSAAERSAANTTRWVSKAVAKSVSGMGSPFSRLSTNA